ncbi:MAG: acyl-CoA thioesterase domain-containing protein [Acidobacteriota bacterium]
MPEASGDESFHVADEWVRERLRALALEPLGDGRYAVPALRRKGPSFGGLLAAQTVVAGALETSADRSLHSIHGHFLRAGRSDEATEIVVERLRDGGSFSTRSASVLQEGREVFRATLGYAVPEDGFAWQEAEMPAAPSPEGLPDREMLRAERYSARFGSDLPIFRSAVEIRLCDPRVVEPGEVLPPEQTTWFRLRSAFAAPDAPRHDLLQQAFLVYATDRTMLGTARLPLELPRQEILNVSLDHAVWLHRPTDVTQWHLMHSSSEVMASARALIQTQVFDQQGKLVASATQEGLVRQRRRD